VFPFGYVFQGFVCPSVIAATPGTSINQVRNTFTLFIEHSFLNDPFCKKWYKFANYM